MSVMPILKMGNPKLFATAENVINPQSEEIKIILQNMLDTMQYFHGVGIAAPQIGISKRIIIYSVNNNPRYPEATPIPLTVLINPEFVVVGEDKILGWEGCLSVPNLRGEVERYHTIRATGLNEHGQPVDKIVSAFESRIIQHECDHLNGTLFLTRISDFSRCGFEDELNLQQGQTN